MKKIAFVSSLSGVGGTEKSLVNFLKALPHNCCTIDLLLIGCKGPLVDEIPDWIHIKYVSQRTNKQYIQEQIKKFRIISFLFGIIRFTQLKAHWHRYKTDTMYQYQKSVHLYKKWMDEYDVAVSWFVPNSIQTVYTLTNVIAKKKILWIHMDVSMDRMPLDALDTFIQYDKIYCVSKACKNSFVKMYPPCEKKVDIYYNILNLNNIIKLGKESVDICNKDKIVLITVGRITYEKQPFFAIEIAKKLLCDGYNNFIWYFVGDGVLYSEMKKKIEQNCLEDYIIMLGVKMNPYKYISNANLYVQMSLHESYCLTLAEAQVLGIPSITTNFPASAEIVTDCYSGYIVNNNWFEIYKKIKELLDFPEKMNDMSMNLSNYKLPSQGDINKFLSYVSQQEGKSKNE